MRRCLCDVFTRLVFEKREALKASLFESHPKGFLEASCSVDAQQQKEVCDSGQTILIEVSCAPFGAPKFGQDLKQIAYGDGPIAVYISCAVNETAPVIHNGIRVEIFSAWIGAARFAQGKYE